MAACYRAQQIAHGVFDVVTGRTKDYLLQPKAGKSMRTIHRPTLIPRAVSTHMHVGCLLRTRTRPTVNPMTESARLCERST
jgi:hypothetical protein